MYCNASIQIDKPEQGWLNTAFVIQDYRDYLSQNSVSYWCYVPEYGIELKIGKRSRECEDIHQAILAKVPQGKMVGILLKIALPHITPSQFIFILDQIRKQSLREGRNSMRERLADILTPE